MEVSPKVSVIVPVYNVEKYLERCIQSITNQTYSNLEIILINDGSTDNSGSICDYYASIDDRISVIHKSNGGLSDARNHGLDKATGEYISFVDSDDVLHSEFIETLIKLLISHNAEIAQCDFLKVRENEYFNIDTGSHSYEEMDLLNNYQATLDLYNENYTKTVVVWNKLYDVRLFTGIRFPYGKYHEDEYTTYQLLFKSSNVVRTSRKLYFYMQRSDSIMGREFSIRRLDALDAYDEQIRFYSNVGSEILKSLAAQRLEGLVKHYYLAVLNSGISNKDQICDYLIDFYKNRLNTFIDSIKHTNRLKLIELMLYRRMTRRMMGLIFKLRFIRIMKH